MARTNTKAHKSTHPASTVLQTYEGAPAKRIDAEAQLRRSVLACLLWEDEFYESGDTIAQRIRSLTAEVAPEKVQALAIEARNKMHLRHVPLWLIVSALRAGHRKGITDTLPQVIQRADELAEFMALYWNEGRVPIAAQAKQGLAHAFRKFDAYQRAKYNRDGAVTLRDVLFMCHATPKDTEQAAIWKQLVDGTLAAPDTWEVALSAGQDKKATWERLIAEGNLGGLAILRNLRNMQKVGMPDAVIERALGEGNFKRVLPFRFVAAAQYAPRFEPSLEAAMLKATADLPKLPGKTVLLVDPSCSMVAPLSARSDLRRFDAACALAVLLREVCERVAILTFASGDLYQVGDRRQPDHVKAIPPRRGFALRDAMGTPAGGTNTEDGKQAADTEGYDRLILITDEQSNQALSNPKGKGYVINVASAKNGIGYVAWTHVDGWSENVVRYITEAEQSRTTS